ncbi:MAG TPA: metallophosphoesterase [Actinomycetota bacterium]|nr:metallophosphoesterase [Actinomycetota bacterium]
MTHVRRWSTVLLAALAVGAACSPDEASVPEPSGPLRSRSPVEGRAFEFAVIGDFGTGEEDQRAVADALRRWAGTRPFEALVTTGDNIYDSGHPDDFAEAWHQPYGWVDRGGIPVIASVGNHDIRTASGAPVMELFSMPGRWYAHRFGPVELFVLDGNRPADLRQLTWLGDALRRSRATWKVAVFHHPAYSCSDHGSTREILERWVPVLQAGGVDLVLSGHDHNYQRFRAYGIAFVVSGGGGAALDAVGDCPAGTPAPLAELDERHHFLYGRATRTRLTLQAVPVPGLRPADRVVLRA